MTDNELAKILRYIEITEFMDGDITEHTGYDELSDDMKAMYDKFAKVYLRYFDMEIKSHDT